MIKIMASKLVRSSQSPSLTSIDTIDTTTKSASLHTCFPMAMIVVLAWACFFSRKDLFKPHSLPYLTLCALSFCACSASMHTLNKECVSLTSAPATLTTIQMIIALVATLVLHAKEIFNADPKKMMRWSIVPLLYAAMLNSSLLGYKYLSLSLVTVFRNLAPLVTMIVESVAMTAEHRPTITAPVVMSLIMMVSGAVMYSHGQAEFSWIGLVLVIVNTAFAILDRLVQRRLLVAECEDLPLSACMTINNSLGMLPSIAFAYFMHEVDGYKTQVWTDPSTICLVFLSGAMGMGIGFFGLMCQQEMTATSFQVLQNLSKVAVVAIGVVIFGDSLDSLLRICGMVMSLLGSAAYGWARIVERDGKAFLPSLTSLPSMQKGTS